MINNEKDFIQGMKGLRLGRGARAHMRSELMAYAELHTMPVNTATPFHSLSFLSTMFLRSRPLMAGAFATVLIVAGSGTATFAAEKAAPGDALYAVKVHVNEPVLTAFAGSGEAQARVHAKLAVRRVEEAEILQKRGTLTVAIAEDLSNRFSQEADKAVEEADKLETSGDVSASLAIRSELVLNLNAYVPTDTLALATMAAPAAPEADTRMMKGAAMATTMMEASLPTPEPATDFQSIVARKIAFLNEGRDRVEVAVVSPQDNASLAKRTDKVAIEVTESETPHALLAGSSVASAVRNSATTTASSSEATTTPALGKSFFAKLLRSRLIATTTPTTTSTGGEVQESSAGTIGLPVSGTLEQ